MGPIVKEVSANYAGKSIQFVTFDSTTDASKAEGVAKAEALGVMNTYNKNAAKSGFALLYSTKDSKIVTTLSAKNDAAAWQTEIDKALGEGA